MAEVSKMRNINPGCIILPITFCCLRATDVGRTCARRVKIPIFKAMMDVAIRYGWHMWDPVVCVSTAVECRSVRVRGFVHVIDEGSEGCIAGARLTHRIDSDIIEYRRELCCRKRCKRATQAEYSY